MSKWGPTRRQHHCSNMLARVHFCSLALRWLEVMLDTCRLHIDIIAFSTANITVHQPGVVLLQQLIIGAIAVKYSRPTAQVGGEGDQKMKNASSLARSMGFVWYTSASWHASEIIQLQQNPKHFCHQLPELLPVISSLRTGLNNGRRLVDVPGQQV